MFIEVFSKRNETRKEIIEKFEDINDGSEDMAALWLECNTWKSLVAIKGNHRVKRGFKIEDDLTPRSFAPGAGNMPDMELYINGYILLPEVSLMQGVQQWEHEGSSVISHVLRFIEKYKDKEVYGLFISKKMNIRTMWQFFILNRESWVGACVPVIPITISQYIAIIQHIYDNELTIYDLKDLITAIRKNALECPNYLEWEKNIPIIINSWIDGSARKVSLFEV